LENCNRDSSAAVSADWRYLGAMTGTIKFDTAAPVAISSRNGGFQFGKGASGQNPNILSASGQFSLANGRQGGFAFLLTNPEVAVCPFVPNPCLRDTVPPVFSNCPTNINVVTSQNSVAINWATPSARDNCSPTVLILSNFQPGQLLPIGQTTVVYLARDTSGNQAECRFVVTVTKVTPTQDLTNTPFEIVRFSPNPTSDILTVEATSPLEGKVVFNLCNALGQVLEQRTQTLKRGENQLTFDVSRLPNGVYWLKPAAINGQKAMVKFIKM
jgi:HYR domain/Secretion system C-terminal sorting domain